VALDALKALTHLAATMKPPVWLKDDGMYTDLNDVLYAPEDIVSFRNRLLHLSGRELVAHTPQLFVVNTLDFDYDPQAAAPTNWFAFLNSVWPDDPEVIDTLQEIFGYLLTADTRQQKIFLIVGPKRSGKGTIARVLTHMLGAANVVAPTLASLSTNFGLQPLIGKPAAIISDARLGGRSDLAAVVERLLTISGEDRLTIDRKYREAWHGSLPTRFLILSNELPRLTDASGALAGRFVPLVMQQSFYGHEDHGLGERLLPERPGILNWSLVGLDRLRRRGHFVVPKSSAEAQQELEDLSSPIGAFLREKCVVAPGQEVELDNLYRAWVGWCHASNRLPSTPQTFGRDLRAAVSALKVSNRRLGPAQKRFYKGVGLQS
jgi:putative DNA primase/helicase